MSLNCTEINIILEELDLTGSFIQQIVQPSFDTLALYTYKNSTAKTVLICLGAGACRINETRKKIPKTEKPLRFMEFMKSRIKGCRIQSCKQIGFERIIQMELSHGDEEFLMFKSSGQFKIEKGEEGEIIETYAKRSLRNVSGAYRK